MTYKPMDLSTIKEDIVNNSVFFSMINEVLEMIAGNAANPYYKMNKSNITLKEKIFCKSIYEKDIYDYLDTSMQKIIPGKYIYRFIYMDDIETGTGYKKIKTAELSNLNRNKTLYLDQFETYFLDAILKDEADLKRFIQHMIKCKFDNYISTKSESDYDLESFIIALDGTVLVDSSMVDKLVNAFYAYVGYISALDLLLDLKYDDFEDVNIIRLIRNDDIKEMVRKFYNYAIEGINDKAELNILISESVEKLIDMKKSITIYS